MPAAELEAGFRVGADVFEAQRFMQGDAACVGERNAGKGPAITLGRQDAQQRRVERAADAFAPRSNWSYIKPELKQPVSELQ